MTNARNIVISGKYEGKYIIKTQKRNKHGSLTNVLKLSDIEINERTIKSVEMLDKQNSKDTGSAVARGIVGGAILGGAGLVAGTMTGKTSEINTVTITYIDDSKSLLEVDSTIYKDLLKIDWNIKNGIFPDENEDKKFEKKKIIALILCILFGGFGGHRFYLGYSISPIIMMISFILAVVLHSNAVNFLYHIPYIIWLGFWVWDIVKLSKNQLKTVAGIDLV